MQHETVSEWHATFLDCCAQLDGAMIGKSAFGPGAAVWVGKREIAHFDSEHTLDIRLTKGLIRSRRRELNADIRIHLRPSNSDWLDLRVEDQSDAAYALTLVHEAITANLPTAPPGRPPTGSELERRRRIH
jgi:hypothetical protein